MGITCDMIAGFLAVPLLKFVAPPLLDLLGWERGTSYLNALDVLLPAFLISGTVGVLVSALDKSGREKLEGIENELSDAGRRG